MSTGGTRGGQPQLTLSIARSDRRAPSSECTRRRTPGASRCRVRGPQWVGGGRHGRRVLPGVRGGGLRGRALPHSGSRAPSPGKDVLLSSCCEAESGWLSSTPSRGRGRGLQRPVGFQGPGSRVRGPQLPPPVPARLEAHLGACGRCWGTAWPPQPWGPLPAAVPPPPRPRVTDRRLPRPVPRAHTRTAPLASPEIVFTGLPDGLGWSFEAPGMRQKSRRCPQGHTKSPSHGEDREPPRATGKQASTAARPRPRGPLPPQTLCLPRPRWAAGISNLRGM